MKHTKGPWTVGVVDTAYEINTEKEGHSIAWVEPFFQMGDMGVNQANARLIAAAPELLEACKKLIAELHLWNDGVYEEETEQVLLEAKAVIAKAEGRE